MGTGRMREMVICKIVSPLLSNLAVVDTIIGLSTSSTRTSSVSVVSGGSCSSAHGVRNMCSNIRTCYGGTSSGPLLLSLPLVCSTVLPVRRHRTSRRLVLADFLSR